MDGTTIEDEVIKLACIAHLTRLPQSNDPEAIQKFLKERERKAQIYNKTYIYNPNERMAELDGIEEVKKVLKILKAALKGKYKIENFYEAEYIVHSLLAYEQSPELSPFLTFLKSYDPQKEFGEYSIYDPQTQKVSTACLNLPLEKRIYYGFPITKKEQKNMRKEKELQLKRFIQ